MTDWVIRQMSAEGEQMDGYVTDKGVRMFDWQAEKVVKIYSNEPYKE